MISLQIYELCLSSQTRIHPVFNTCNLKPHYESISHIISRESLSDIVEDIEEWKVEDIQAER